MSKKNVIEGGFIITPEELEKRGGAPAGFMKMTLCPEWAVVSQDKSILVIMKDGTEPCPFAIEFRNEMEVLKMSYYLVEQARATWPEEMAELEYMAGVRPRGKS